jgi:tRNA A-37 threonylcarbamoyl transferase component Bud32
MTSQATLDRWSVSLDRAPSLDPRRAASQQPEAKLIALEISEPATPGVSVPQGFIEFHPRFRTWLNKCGIRTASDALGLTGEVVCGHPDRHVMRVELCSGVRTRVVFLKREHLVSRKVRSRNRKAGFGAVSRCTREARLLQQLEEKTLPGPQWLAYGEDAQGQAFLLVDELAGSVELREYLSEVGNTADDRRAVFQQAGRTLAEWHLAGFSTPELGAKHLFVSASSLTVTLLDWQSATANTSIPDAERIRWLGTLHATLAEELATPRERLRFLASYRRTLQSHTPDRRLTRMSAWVRLILKEATQAAKKSSVLAQRQSVFQEQAQRLVWLAGEAVVTIPEVAVGWPHPPIQQPFYRDDPKAPPETRERYTLPDGTASVLVRFRTRDRLGRGIAALRERPWRSPGAKAARIMFHLQRHGIPAPRLLAFGQKLFPRAKADSFVLAEMNPGARPLTQLGSVEDLSPCERFSILRQCGRLLRQLHDAGCRPNPKAGANDPLFALEPGTEPRVVIGSPWAIQLARKATARQKQADVLRTLGLLGPLSRTDRRRFRKSYEGQMPSPVSSQK